MKVRITSAWDKTSSRDEAMVRRSSACTAAPEYTPLVDVPQLLSLIRLSRQSITVRKSVGESTEPCFTPRPTQNGSDRVLFSLTRQGTSVYQDLSKRHSLPLIPISKSCFRRTGSSMEGFLHIVEAQILVSTFSDMSEDSLLCCIDCMGTREAFLVGCL